jgi:hypothetical protein
LGSGRRRTIEPGYSWHPLLKFAATERNRLRLQAARRVNEWLKTDPDLTLIVPIKERSLEIFGDEKRLDELRGGTTRLFGSSSSRTMTPGLRLPLGIAPPDAIPPSPTPVAGTARALHTTRHSSTSCAPASGPWRSSTSAISIPRAFALEVERQNAGRNAAAFRFSRLQLFIVGC